MNDDTLEKRVSDLERQLAEALLHMTKLDERLKRLEDSVKVLLASWQGRY